MAEITPMGTLPPPLYVPPEREDMAAPKNDVAGLNPARLMLLALLRSTPGESSAVSEFRRMMRWIALVGVAMAAGAIWYLSLFDLLNIHTVIATIAGVFLSVTLGCGLFAAAFFSDKSGHDQSVTNATSVKGVPPNPVALPEGLVPVRRTDRFTEKSIPAGLLRQHNTKSDTWGLIRIESGRLRYRITDPGRPAFETVLVAGESPGIVEPSILHEVAVEGPVAFYVEFFRVPPEA